MSCCRRPFTSTLTRSIHTPPSPRALVAPLTAPPLLLPQPAGHLVCSHITSSQLYTRCSHTTPVHVYRSHIPFALLYYYPCLHCSYIMTPATSHASLFSKNRCLSIHYHISAAHSSLHHIMSLSRCIDDKRKKMTEAH